jgi:integrase
MATLYQRNGGDIWYVDFVYRGKRRRESTGTSDRKLAELRLKDIEVGVERDNLGFGKKDRKEVRLTKFIEDYLEYSEAGKAEKTFWIDRRALQLLKGIVGDLDLPQISPKSGEDYKIHLRKKMKPISVNLYLRHVKSACETAVKWGYIPANPLKDVKPCKVKNENIPRFFTKEEIRRLLETIPDGEFKNFVLFCLYSGCRRNEALSLKWEDVDMQQGQVIFRVTKSGKSRVMPFNDHLRQVLGSMPRDREKLFSIQPDFVTHKFKDYLKASGIKNQSLKVHSLRHTFASHLLMQGADVMTVSKMLGHSSIRVTEMYAHLVPDHMRASIERLSFE